MSSEGIASEESLQDNQETNFANFFKGNIVSFRLMGESTNYGIVFDIPNETKKKNYKFLYYKDILRDPDDKYIKVTLTEELLPSGLLRYHLLFDDGSTKYIDEEYVKKISDWDDETELPPESKEKLLDAYHTERTKTDTPVPSPFNSRANSRSNSIDYSEYDGGKRQHKRKNKTRRRNKKTKRRRNRKTKRR